MSNHFRTMSFAPLTLVCFLFLCSVAMTGCESEADRVIDEALKMEEEGNHEEAYDFVQTTLEEAEWGTFSAEEEEELLRLKDYLDRQIERHFELDLDATVDAGQEHEIIDEGRPEDLQVDTEVLGLDDWEPTDSEVDDAQPIPENIEIDFDDDAVEIPDDLREQLEELEGELQDE